MHRPAAELPSTIDVSAVTAMSWKPSSVQHKACGVMMTFSNPSRGRTLAFDRFTFGHVEAGARDAAFDERGRQRLLVMDRAAAHIEVVRVRLHQREFRRIDQMPRLVVE